MSSNGNKRAGGGAGELPAIVCFCCGYTPLYWFSNCLEQAAVCGGAMSLDSHQKSLLIGLGVSMCCDSSGITGN